MRNKFWAADQVWVHIKGAETQRFISAAAKGGVRMAHLQPKEDGFIAQAFGADLNSLRQIAKNGGWQFAVLRYHGPGRLVEYFAKRPGIPIGILIFVVLLPILTSFVWVIDFGTLEGEQQERLRTLLEGYGVYEGAWLPEEQLKQIQTTALQQTDTFGWISLNFTAGCLSVESTAAQYQEIRGEPLMQALYARESGEILAIETQSGFTVVEPGQQVEKGQLLVDVVRLDRKGEEVPQGASGEITAIVRKSYTSYQPFQVSCTGLNGSCITQARYTILGHEWLVGEEILPTDAQLQTDWEPLCIGRVALPGGIRFQTAWQQTEQTVIYTLEQAKALAHRDCRLQLYADFPDAVIKAEHRSLSSDVDGVYCTITYDFYANIAQPQP